MYPTTRLASFIEKRFHEHYRKLKGEFTKREKERRLVEDLAREQEQKLQRMIQEEGDRQREGMEAQHEEEVLVVSAHRDHKLPKAVLAGQCRLLHMIVLMSEP